MCHPFGMTGGEGNRWKTLAPASKEGKSLQAGMIGYGLNNPRGSVQ